CPFWIPGRLHQAALVGPWKPGVFCLLLLAAPKPPVLAAPVDVADEAELSLSSTLNRESFVTRVPSALTNAPIARRNASAMISALERTNSTHGSHGTGAAA